MAFTERCSDDWADYKDFKKSEVKKYAHAPFHRTIVEKIISNLETIDQIYDGFFEGREKDFYDYEEGNLFADIEEELNNLLDSTNKYIEKLGSR